MTCIVAIEDEEDVYIGADKISSDGHIQTVDSQSKLFQKDEFIIGCAGSWRAKQILEKQWNPPERLSKHETDRDYLIAEIVPSIMEIYEDQYYGKEEDGQKEKRSAIMVGYNGCAYMVQRDYAVLRNTDGFAALGSGDSFALGALEANKGSSFTPEKKLKEAVEAASRFCTTVGGGFDVITNQS